MNQAPLRNPISMRSYCRDQLSTAPALLSQLPEGVSGVTMKIPSFDESLARSVNSNMPVWCVPAIVKVLGSGDRARPVVQVEEVSEGFIGIRRPQGVTFSALLIEKDEQSVCDLTLFGKQMMIGSWAHRLLISNLLSGVTWPTYELSDRAPPPYRRRQDV